MANRLIPLGDPRWHTHCQACGQTKENPPEGSRPTFYYYGGQYHAGACYDTLFGICTACGQKNMSVRRNNNPNTSSPSWVEPLCDACHSKKYGWYTVTISSGPF
jgi:hypothetical protein